MEMKTLVCTKPGRFEYATGRKPELKKARLLLKLNA
jgi:hypothetical protein